MTTDCDCILHDPFKGQEPDFEVLLGGLERAYEAHFAKSPHWQKAKDLVREAGTNLYELKELFDLDPNAPLPEWMS